MLKIRVRTNYFNATDFRPKTRQGLDDPAREGRIDTTIASDSEDNVSNTFLNRAA